jgi:hypothetical protein
MLKDFIWGPVGCKRAMHACCFRKISYFCSMHGALSGEAAYAAILRTPQVYYLAFISGINGNSPLPARNITRH